MYVSMAIGMQWHTFMYQQWIISSRSFLPTIIIAFQITFLSRERKSIGSIGWKALDSYVNDFASSRIPSSFTRCDHIYNTIVWQIVQMRKSLKVEINVNYFKLLRIGACLADSRSIMNHAEKKIMGTSTLEEDRPAAYTYMFYVCIYILYIQYMCVRVRARAPVYTYIDSYI